jgi:hypothetical protein
MTDTKRVRLVCKVCGPQKRVFLIKPGRHAYEKVELALNNHENSWPHVRRTQVHLEDAP